MLSNEHIALIVAAVVIIAGVAIWAIRKNEKAEGFTRTCITADTSCRFTRTPVDYALKDISEVPAHIGFDFPHWIVNPKDELQPLSQAPALIPDEQLLWNQDKLFKQYDNNWAGCGDGQSYIINDDKTRLQLAETGDIPLHRYLNSVPPTYDIHPVDADRIKKDLLSNAQFKPIYTGRIPAVGV